MAVTRLLGRSAMPVSAMGMGCWAIGGPLWRGEAAVGWSTVDDAESTRAIHAALELGITFFDTADVYGAGHSEIVLGQALAGRSERVTVATKFGNVFDVKTKQIVGRDASPAFIRQACEASRKRLGRDTIDLYQLHIGDLDAAEVPAVLDTLDDLVAEGKVRAYGWSTDDPDCAALFAARPNCTSVQHRLNVLQDNAAMITLCEQRNLASINRTALAMGLLTGKFGPQSTLPDDDVRGRNAPAWLNFFVDGHPSPELLRRIAAIHDILTSEGRTLAQGSLAWLWARSPQTIPIPGFRTVKQVQENCAAMDTGPLKPEQMEAIDRLLER